MEFILATSNAHKALEFSELYDKNLINIKAAPEKLEVDETGKTYFENAFLKAKAYYDKYKVPVLADDSGLNVASFPDDLGIYSARFGGPNLSDADRANLLLKKFEEKPNADRSAYFTCVLCFYLSASEVYYFEGRMTGKIAYSYRGAGGFGYDPIFIPADYPQNNEELTVAEVGNWKNDHSHRAHAVKLSIKFFREKLLPK